MTGDVRTLGVIPLKCPPLAQSVTKKCDGEGEVAGVDVSLPLPGGRGMRSTPLFKGGGRFSSPPSRGQRQMFHSPSQGVGLVVHSSFKG